MNRKNTRAALPALAISLLLVCVLPANAQQTRTLQIRDGEVRVDNNVVPSKELPESLEVEGVDMALSFSGIDKPVVRIGEHYYVLAEGRLTELDADTYRLNSADEDGGSLEESRWYRIGFSDAMTRSQMRELEGKAAKIREMSEELATHPGAEENRLAEEMKQTARMAAEMAAELPKVQAASYWNQVRATDRDLYDQLVREWNLESQIQRLAQQVRQLSVTGGKTDQEVTELRSLLGEAFELKQNNRRREIEQLEGQLEALDAEMKKRQEAREAIIDRRLRELIGSY